MSLVLAVIPILIVLIGIIFLKKPAWIVALIGAGITFILAVTAFQARSRRWPPPRKAGHISLAGCIPGMGSIRAAGTDAGQHRHEPDQDDSQFFDQGQARADRPDSFLPGGLY